MLRDVVKAESDNDHVLSNTVVAGICKSVGVKSHLAVVLFIFLPMFFCLVHYTITTIARYGEGWRPSTVIPLRWHRRVEDERERETISKYQMILPVHFYPGSLVL
jgi:hypothetical protein